MDGLQPNPYNPHRQRVQPAPRRLHFGLLTSIRTKVSVSRCCTMPAASSCGAKRDQKSCAQMEKEKKIGEVLLISTDNVRNMVRNCFSISWGGSWVYIAWMVCDLLTTWLPASSKAKIPATHISGSKPYFQFLRSNYQSTPWLSTGSIHFAFPYWAMLVGHLENYRTPRPACFVSSSARRSTAKSASAWPFSSCRRRISFATSHVVAPNREMPGNLPESRTRIFGVVKSVQKNVRRRTEEVCESKQISRCHISININKSCGVRAAPPSCLCGFAPTSGSHPWVARYEAFNPQSLRVGGSMIFHWPSLAYHHHLNIVASWPMGIMASLTIVLHHDFTFEFTSCFEKLIEFHQKGGSYPKLELKWIEVTKFWGVWLNWQN